jgi:hypothetical protein
MVKTNDSSDPIKNQYRAYLILVVIVVGITLILSVAGDSYFSRFWGDMHPLLVMILSGFLGFLFLSFLLSQGFSIYGGTNLLNAIRYSWWMVLFPLIAILVDYFMVFPQDMNVSFPESLLFYPAIAFFVEIAFHVMPFVLLFYGLTTLFRKISHNKISWFCIGMVAILEPTFQVYFMQTDPAWARIIVWINLYLFNWTQLVVFKKFDFISMYALRIFYYLIWHIIWGALRLEILF